MTKRPETFVPLFDGTPPARDALRRAITTAWLEDESTCVARLLDLAELSATCTTSIQSQAADWVRGVRALRDQQSPLDAFMQQYDLSSEEGVLLMCLAEALLRIPDDDTAEKLIADKLGEAHWESHLGRSDSLFVNASTWGLMLTGRIVKLSPETTSNFRRALQKLVGKSSEPVIRLAIRQAMRMMGHQFVIGRSIAEALRQTKAKKDWQYSFDMLGEAALTASDAARFFKSYQDAIATIGKAAGPSPGADVMQRPGISVKLSALHPRYEFAQRNRVLRELTPVLLELAQAARAQNIGLTVDAEEADRLELSLDVFEAVFRDPSLEGWEGFGLAVQAFQKRTLPLLEWLEALARPGRRKVPVRLVKGAYWDTEIKRAQEQGLPGYPVFTRKVATDVSYLACARRLLSARDVFYPQFATHNAHTIAAVAEYAGDSEGFEFQRLHGMGEALYTLARRDVPVQCRVYGPVGSHEDLLPYLVRRLLENGANTSFVHRIFDEEVPPEQLVADPVAAMRATDAIPNPAIPLPEALFGTQRLNSAGLNLASEREQVALFKALASVAPEAAARKGRAVTDPSDRRRVIGEWESSNLQDVSAWVGKAQDAQAAWNARPIDQRSEILERAAAAVESSRPEFLFLLVREAGKTLPDAISEIREAVDFLRYYAAQARKQLRAIALPGPTGEHNELQAHGRGVFVCISPWNFPLAIFAGQIAAALAAGNSVIAKPAEQTNLIALRLVALLHAAGVPKDVLQCVLGEGEVGAALTRQEGIAGVAFTGSMEVARLINRSLAAREGPIASLIAETGGQNALIADSSALPEQLVKDTVMSAFNAAGQRCSALRVLFLQEDIAAKVTRMLKGAMQELVIGDPGLLSTDVGPVIDAEAQQRLEQHAERIKKDGELIAHLQLPDTCRHGSYFAPCAVAIGGLSQLTQENFGPMLHIVRYKAKDLEAVVQDINRSKFGLTLGVHSRIESTWRRVQAVARVGNCYINRNMIGAVVGVQPFGGEGLSGTGPKAGGPHYLTRFTTERTLTVNTAAVGGNASLLAGG